MGWYGGGGGGTLPSAAPWTLEGNPSASTSTITAFTIGGLAGKTTPAGTDQLLLQDNAASGALKFVNWSNLPSGGGGGMSIGGAVTSGTAGSVLFVNPTATLAQDNTKFFWDDTGFVLQLSGGGINFNSIGSQVFSFEETTTPVGLHVYKTLDSVTTPTNWERAVLDWNVTSNVFTIGTQKGGTGQLRDIYYYSAGLLALYRVPNASGDNWFEGGAGNLTTTGFSNFGTGAGCLTSVTSGDSNTGLGDNSLTALTTGRQNTAIGTGSLNSVVSGNYNLAFGFNALLKGGSSGGNIYDSIGIGNSSGQLATTSFSSIFIGSNAYGNGLNSSRDVMVGYQVGSGFNGSTQANVIIGGFGFRTPTAGDYNTVIGDSGGYNLTGTSSHNTLIGTWQGPSAAVNNVIAISDGNNPANPQLDFNYTTASVWTFAFKIAVPGAANPVLTTTAAITTGAGAGAGTLTNAPAAGNPTKWIPISDAGTTRYIPAW